MLRLLFALICGAGRRAVTILCSHSIAPCTYKDNASSSNIYDSQKLVLVDIQIGLLMCPLADLVGYPAALPSTLLQSC